MIASVDGAVEARIARLEAVEAIQVLKARYADVCDTGYDPVRMRPFFTNDAVWEFFGGISNTITWALHYMVAPIIEIADDGRTATGSWYLLEPCTIATS